MWLEIKAKQGRGFSPLMYGHAKIQMRNSMQSEQDAGHLFFDNGILLTIVDQCLFVNILAL